MAVPYKNQIKMNCKGIILPPILIWAAIGLISTIVATKTGFIQFNLTGNKGSIELPNKSVVRIQPTLVPIPVASDSDLINSVKQFYSDISSKQFDAAWNLLDKNPTSYITDYSQGYDNFVNYYSAVENITFSDIHIIPDTNNVFFKITLTELNNGQKLQKSYHGWWTFLYDGNNWRMDSEAIALLDANGNPVEVYHDLIFPNATRSTAIQANPTPEAPYTLIASPSPTTSPIHDGSRTGQIIDYFELATGKHISVYENEPLPYTIDGKQYLLTKGDIDWYEKQKALTNQIVNSNTNTNPSLNNSYQTPHYPSYPIYSTSPSENSYSQPSIGSPSQDAYKKVYGNSNSTPTYSSPSYNSSGYTSNWNPNNYPNTANTLDILKSAFGPNGYNPNAFNPKAFGR